MYCIQLGCYVLNFQSKKRLSEEPFHLTLSPHLVATIIGFIHLCDLLLQGDDAPGLAANWAQLRS